MQNDFKIGDEVYHASLPGLIMVIEGLNERGIFCTWIDPKSLNKDEGYYAPTSLRKKYKGSNIRTVSFLK